VRSWGCGVQIQSRGLYLREFVLDLGIRQTIYTKPFPRSDRKAQSKPLRSYHYPSDSTSSPPFPTCIPLIPRPLSGRYHAPSTNPNIIFPVNRPLQNCPQYPNPMPNPPPPPLPLKYAPCSLHPHPPALTSAQHSSQNIQIFALRIFAFIPRGKLVVRSCAHERVSVSCICIPLSTTVPRS